MLVLVEIQPFQKQSKKTTTPSREAWPETELASGVAGCALEAPVSSACRFARERIVVPLGSSEWHEPEPGANGRPSRHLCVTGIVRRVKDAGDGHER